MGIPGPVLSDIFINYVGKGSEKKMANFACDNKLLTTRKTRESYAGECTLQTDFMLLVGRGLQYLVNPNATKHRNAFEEKNTSTLTDPALIAISQKGDITYFCDNICKCSIISSEVS